LKSEISNQQSAISNQTQSSVLGPPILKIALLTGGGDRPYALGLAAALTSAGIQLDFIGSDELDVPEVVNNPRVNFLNLRGDQRPEVNATAKVLRVLKYYSKLIFYMRDAKRSSFISCGTISLSLRSHTC